MQVLIVQTRLRCGVVDFWGASKIEVGHGSRSRVLNVRNSLEQRGRQCLNIRITMQANGRRRVVMVAVQNVREVVGRMTC